VGDAPEVDEMLAVRLAEAEEEEVRKAIDRSEIGGADVKKPCGRRSRP
jgi:hypothetical protein